MASRYDEKSIGYSLPITLGAFFREFMAVTVLLVLQERAGKYDFFTQGLVMFLIFMTFRVPYINSFTLLFETIALGKWRARHSMTMHRHTHFTQNVFHVLMIFVAHVLGSFAAAAARVYMDVTYGTEIMEGNSFAHNELAPGLTVDVDALRRFDESWGGASRLSRLEGINGTLTQLFPMSQMSDLGIGTTALTIWYISEEIGYVLILCVCYVHIWLGAGVGENVKPVRNPFKQAYWQFLFRVSLLVTLIYLAMYRAFPTAHGSLHVTIYKIQYQLWNPNVRVLDDDHYETAFRIIGGFLGVVAAVIYNNLLVNTEDVSESSDPIDEYYYKLVWGMEPDKRRRKGGTERAHDEESDSGDAGGRAAVCKVVNEIMRTVCRCNGAGCAACMAPGPSSGAALRSDFKLRIPHLLDHPK